MLFLPRAIYHEIHYKPLICCYGQSAEYKPPSTAVYGTDVLAMPRTSNIATASKVSATTPITDKASLLSEDYYQVEQVLNFPAVPPQEKLSITQFSLRPMVCLHYVTVAVVTK